MADELTDDDVMIEALELLVGHLEGYAPGHPDADQDMLARARRLLEIRVFVSAAIAAQNVLIARMRDEIDEMRARDLASPALDE